MERGISHGIKNTYNNTTYIRYIHDLNPTLAQESSPHSIHQTSSFRPLTGLANLKVVNQPIQPEGVPNN
jgi:hypothetical protein